MFQVIKLELFIKYDMLVKGIDSWKQWSNTEPLKSSFDNIDVLLTGD